MKRATWFLSGVAAGAAGAGYAKKKVRRTASQLAPANVARSAMTKVKGRVKGRGRHVVDAVREGRAAMHAREDELKARRDARFEPLDARLEPDEQLLVDGRPVDSGRVIVLKQKR